MALAIPSTDATFRTSKAEGSDQAVLAISTLALALYRLRCPVLGQFPLRISGSGSTLVRILERC